MKTVTEYISNFEPDIRERLEALRDAFFAEVPDTEESISYNMPAFTVGKHRLYFAAYKNHIGFYPVYGLPAIEVDVAPYRAKNAKDSLHFPHKKPLPLALVRRIIQARLKK